MNLDTVNDELNECIKPSNTLKEIEYIDSKTELSEVNENILQPLIKNINDSNTINHKISTLDISDKLDNSKSLEGKKISNDRNNHTKTNDNSLAILNSKINLTNLSKPNTFTDLNNLVNIKKYKQIVNHFFQNVEMELNKFHNCLNDQSTVIHNAHLDTEVSKKKELEVIVAEFEKKRINSPNPFLFVAELKNAIHEFI